MDDIDLAQERETAARAALIARATAKPTGPLLTSTTCEDCAQPIPEPRRRAVPGARRCADCQQDRER